MQQHLRNMVGLSQLYADLSSDNAPNLAFISPNQCHDQHGRGSSEMGTGCSVDANAIAQGDAALQDLVTAIHSSRVWNEGSRTAIVVVWDENDYSSLPNQVVTTVDTNYGVHGVKSGNAYNHFSLLKTLVAGFGLSYLNHAADKTVRADSASDFLLVNNPTAWSTLPAGLPVRGQGFEVTVGDEAYQVEGRTLG